MYFTSSNIVHYKNISGATLTYTPGFNWLLGANGMGKTNILDALHVMCLTKSHTNRTDAECVQSGTDYYTLTGHLQHENETHKIYAAYDIRKQEKAFIYDDVPCARFSEHIGRIPLMCVFPDDIELINDSSEHRRRLIDNTLSQEDAAYLQDLILYNKYLAQRNALLKQAQLSGTLNTTVLEALDVPMSHLAKGIYEKRVLFFERYKTDVSSIYKNISGSHEEVVLNYESHLHGNEPLALLQKHAHSDMASGGTRYGIHRDDIRMTINSLDMRKHGSQGQKKTLLCALKLAQAAYMQALHHQPVIILDDIFDKLDNNRVQNILRYVDAAGSQIFISHTDAQEAQTIAANLTRPSLFFNIKDGIIVS